MRRAALVGSVLFLVACRAGAFHGPLPLLEQRDVRGAMPRLGALSTGGETRPALLETARYKVALPARPLLTFGVGASWAGQGDAPGWLHLTVRAGGRVLDERKLNPRSAHG